MAETSNLGISQIVQFFSGTTLVGLLTIAINYQIQNRKEEQTKIIENKKMELAEMEQIGKFLANAIDDNPGKRMRFAEYFAAMTTSPELKKNWILYRDSVVGKEIENTQKIIAELKSGNQTPEVKERISDLELSIKGNLKYTQTGNLISDVQRETENDNNPLVLADVKQKQEVQERKQEIQDLLNKGDYEEVLKIDATNPKANYELFVREMRNNPRPSATSNYTRYLVYAQEMILAKNASWLLYPALEFDLKGKKNEGIKVLDEILVYYSKPENQKNAGKFASISTELLKANSSENFKTRQRDVADKIAKIARGV